MNGYGSGSSHEVKAEDLSGNDVQDVKPNLYALKNEMQASDYSNKGNFTICAYVASVAATFSVYNNSYFKRSTVPY